jgi:hypothetical protein
MRGILKKYLRHGLAHTPNSKKKTQVHLGLQKSSLWAWISVLFKISSQIT